MPQTLLTDRYAAKIRGVLSCFDRIVLTATLPEICHPEGMAKYLSGKGIRIFDFTKWAEPLNLEIRAHAEKLAQQCGLEVDYIKKPRGFRKEERIKDILATRGSQPGMVHIFSVIESCTEYRPWYDKPSGKTFLRRKESKCLHYYFYFIDPELGLCYFRIPLWAPFRLQFYCNGHSMLATRLRQKRIAYDLRDNAFVQIADWQAAQELADSLSVEYLHRRLREFVRRFCPVARHFPSEYHWSFMQVEYALDIVFQRQSDLAPIYDSLVRTAVHAVKAADVATFLGRKLTDRTPDEVGNNFETRIEGTRIRHHMGWAAIKMYDKFALILRIETVCNDVSFFRHYRRVERKDGSSEMKFAPMKRSIYSFPALREALGAANRRYLEFLSTLDDPSAGITSLDRISQPTRKGDRSFRGFNLFTREDRRVFELILQGQFNISGFRNKHLRNGLLSCTSARASRILARLRLHGLIKKVAHHSKYYLTRLGRAVAAAALGLRAFFLIPQLARPLAVRLRA
jgi:hypothetical protein